MQPGSSYLLCSNAVSEERPVFCFIWNSGFADIGPSGGNGNDLYFCTEPGIWKGRKGKYCGTFKERLAFPGIRKAYRGGWIKRLLFTDEKEKGNGLCTNLPVKSLILR